MLFRNSNDLYIKLTLEEVIFSFNLLIFFFTFYIGYAEDVPDVGIFTYRLKGFDQQPTDHYMRSYYVDASPMFQHQKPFCYGSLPRHKVAIWLNILFYHFMHII